jgi:uncharacterized protein
MMNKPVSSLFAAIAAGAFVLVVAACAPPAAASNAPAADAGVPAASRPAQAAVVSNSDTLPATISVNGVGTASATPDVAYVQLGVEAINTDPAAAVKENTDKMTAVLAALQAQGIAAEDIQTVNYDMTLEQVVDQDGKPSGEIRYHISNVVRVKVTDLSKVGSVLSAALEAGANTVSGIEFSVLDPVALQTQARDKAIADAQAKATQLASGFGAKLGPIHNVNEFSGPVAPSPRFAASAAVTGNGEVPVSPGQFTVTIEVQATYDIAH